MEGIEPNRGVASAPVNNTAESYSLFQEQPQWTESLIRSFELAAGPPQQEAENIPMYRQYFTYEQRSKWMKDLLRLFELSPYRYSVDQRKIAKALSCMEPSFNTRWEQHLKRRKEQNLPVDENSWPSFYEWVVSLMPESGDVYQATFDRWLAASQDGRSPVELAFYIASLEDRLGELPEYFRSAAFIRAIDPKLRMKLATNGLFCDTPRDILVERAQGIWEAQQIESYAKPNIPKFSTPPVDKEEETSKADPSLSNTQDNTRVAAEIPPPAEIKKEIKCPTCDKTGHQPADCPQLPSKAPPAQPAQPPPKAPPAKPTELPSKAPPAKPTPNNNTAGAQKKSSPAKTEVPPVKTEAPSAKTEVVVKCSSCSQEGHNTLNCPQSLCSLCDKTGHVTSRCPTRLSKSVSRKPSNNTQGITGDAKKVLPPAPAKATPMPAAKATPPPLVKATPPPLVKATPAAPAKATPTSPVKATPLPPVKATIKGPSCSYCTQKGGDDSVRNAGPSNALKKGPATRNKQVNSGVPNKKPPPTASLPAKPTSTTASPAAQKVEIQCSSCGQKGHEPSNCPTQSSKALPNGQSSSVKQVNAEDSSKTSNPAEPPSTKPPPAKTSLAEAPPAQSHRKNGLFTEPAPTMTAPTQVPSTTSPPTQPSSAKAPLTQPASAKASAIQASSTAAPTTQPSSMAAPSTQPKAQVQCSTCNQKGHEASNCPASKMATHGPAQNAKLDNNQNTNSGPLPAKASLKCTACGQDGHLAANCLKSRLETPGKGPPPGGFKTNYKNVICYICNKKGHNGNRCRYRSSAGYDNIPYDSDRSFQSRRWPEDGWENNSDSSEDPRHYRPRDVARCAACGQEDHHESQCLKSRFDTSANKPKPNGRQNHPEGPNKEPKKEWCSTCLQQGHTASHCLKRRLEMSETKSSNHKGRWDNPHPKKKLRQNNDENDLQKAIDSRPGESLRSRMS
ncbi:hypothetical protein BZA70DRAFT_308542 [Myxozyma melibiosi]|uniref:CCHC-type domain-containing protein n=1 Tax=Myxozyma melibiosi TaxID=54550 RepID=A0ABR1FCZ4_9ASCO